MLKTESGSRQKRIGVSTTGGCTYSRRSGYFSSNYKRLSESFCIKFLRLFLLIFEIDENTKVKCIEMAQMSTEKWFANKDVSRQNRSLHRLSAVPYSKRMWS